MRHLSEEQLRANLSMGKPVEQWLSYHPKDGYAFIKWLRIDRERDGSYSVAYFESFDEGNEGFADIYQFSVRHVDDPEGIINSFNSVKEAIDFAVSTYSALLSKFVTAGMIQEAYLDFVNSKASS